MMSFVLTALLALGWEFAATTALPKAHVLSEEPRIEFLPGFLDVDQVSAIRGLAESLGWEATDDETKQVNGGEEHCVLNRSLASPGSHPAEGWAAARAFEAAATTWAKLPVGSSASIVTRWEPWPPGSHLNRSGMLHLDARHRPRNLRTVLAYLSGAEVAQGGAAQQGVDDGLTVFPCVETDDMPAAEAARRRKLCSRAQRHLDLATEKLRSLHREGLALPPEQQYEFLERHPELWSLPMPEADGSLPVDYQWTPGHDAASAEKGPARADPLFALAEAMCRGKAPGLRVAPVLGAALLVESASKGPKGRLVPDWATWHTGCSPGMGNGRRWTVQLFLDAAVVTRHQKQHKQEEAASCAAEKGGDGSCAADPSQRTAS